MRNKAKSTKYKEGKTHILKENGSNRGSKMAHMGPAAMGAAEHYELRNFTLPSLNTSFFMHKIRS